MNFRGKKIAKEMIGRRLTQAEAEAEDVAD